MLTQYDIDKMKQEFQKGNLVDLYYVASLIELREGVVDEHTYKSFPKYRIIKIKCRDVVNAYFEYLNFVNNPDNYHTEEEEVWYSEDDDGKYINYYTVPNKENSYEKDFNSSMPSIIYGVRRKLFYRYQGTEEIREFNEPSPIKPVYTNTIEYGDLSQSEAEQAQNSGLLDWKYYKVDSDHSVIDDGIEYFNITSNYYILDIVNFPRTEKPLINVKEKCAYFLDRCEAFNYMKQLEA